MGYIIAELGEKSIVRSKRSEEPSRTIKTGTTQNERKEIIMKRRNGKCGYAR
jgi:hypothetical protein